MNPRYYREELKSKPELIKWYYLCQDVWTALILGYLLLLSALHPSIDLGQAGALLIGSVIVAENLFTNRFTNYQNEIDEWWRNHSAEVFTLQIVEADHRGCPEYLKLSPAKNKDRTGNGESSTHIPSHFLPFLLANQHEKRGCYWRHADTLTRLKSATNRIILLSGIVGTIIWAFGADIAEHIT